MKTLKLALVVIFLSCSAAAQNSPDSSGAPDVAVIKISWRSVGINPKLDTAPPNVNPEGNLKAAVNTARINEYNSARSVGTAANPRPPVLLDVPSTPDVPPVVIPWRGFVYEFTIKNTGTKIIRKLAWEYSFTDPVTHQKISQHQYKSSVKLRPGMTTKLVVRSSSPLLGIINARQAGQKNLQDQSSGQMLIQSINYADGSVWQRPSK